MSTKASNPKKGKLSKNKDWAYHFISCCNGCSNDCLYCYAKGDAANKNRIPISDWKNEEVRLHDLNKHYKRFDDPVMFPSTHDITHHNFDGCHLVLEKLLGIGNRVLIVSKPRLKLISKICNDFKKYRNNMIFRFTIGSIDKKILSFWEPNAPKYDERKSALAHAYYHNYRTSVSIEPILDAANIEDLVDDLTPFINHSIWIGTMNSLWYLDTDEEDVKTEAAKKRAARNRLCFGSALSKKIARERKRIESGQSAENLKRIYNKLKYKKLPGQDKPLVQWKSAIKDILGLPRPERPEQWPTDPIPDV